MQIIGFIDMLLTSESALKIVVCILLIVLCLYGVVLSVATIITAIRLRKAGMLRDTWKERCVYFVTIAVFILMAGSTVVCLVT